MNFTCNECNDNSSRDKLGTYLDCNACGTAATRRDLNDFVKSLGPTHPEDVALAIHQRALAMAPKQEADHINDVVKMVAPSGWKLVPVEPTIEMIAALGWGGDEVLAVGHGAISGGIADEYAAMLAAAPAAPAASNGAPELPPLPKADVEGGYYDAESGFTKKAMQEYALTYGRAILAAAGPDAAPNVDVLRDILMGVIPAKMTERHGRDFFQGEGQEEHRAEVKGFNACLDEVYDKANKAFQAALSGSKGN